MGKHKKPEYGEKEARSYAMPDLKTDDAGNIVEGHAAVFGQSYDMYGCWSETIARGAFDNTDFTDVLFDVNHNLDSLPLARSRNNNENSTLQLKIDDQGLATHAVLDVENNSDAKALYNSIKRGDINGMSYIFSVRKDEWQGLDSDYPSRTVTDVAKVWEVSAVSMPANPGTDINARGQSALDSAQKMLDSIRARLESPQSEQRSQQDQLEIERLRAQILMKG